MYSISASRFNKDAFLYYYFQTGRLTYFFIRQSITAPQVIEIHNNYYLESSF
uniref:Uncharacterized protein n=1 Tax=Rhizophagus irregularis (strain DAOM 181602 / DAOM 197198 / MUCL 43194) TaxID=747089 RepID=U9UHM6_RHIID